MLANACPDTVCTPAYVWQADRRHGDTSGVAVKLRTVGSVDPAYMLSQVPRASKVSISPSQSTTMVDPGGNSPARTFCDSGFSTSC